MAQIKKTNAIRILENLKIPYEAKEYDDDGEHPLAKGAAGRTAEKLGVDPATVYKTIVMRTETKELCVFLQSSLHEINLKKARNAAGCKDINPIKPEELLAATGYVRGGTRTGENKHFGRRPRNAAHTCPSRPCKSLRRRSCRFNTVRKKTLKSTNLQISRIKLSAPAFQKY